MFYGIDVSDHNLTSGIEWDRVVKAGKSFVIIRLGWANSDGSLTIDKDFDKKYKGAIEAGLSVGIYIYSYIKIPANAKKAAVNVDCFIRSNNLYLTHPVMFDIEELKVYSDMPREETTAVCKEFLAGIQSLGYFAMLYTYTSFIFSFLNINDLKGFALWVADYRNPFATTCPYGGKWAMWQYKGDTGRCEGVSGKCDLNLTPIDFKKTILERGLNHIEKSKPAKTVISIDPQTSCIATYSLKNDGEKPLSPHFKVKEFGSSYTDVVLIDNRLLFILERLHEDFKMDKLVINSGYRTDEHSLDVGGYESDLHTKGQAVDFTGYSGGKEISAKDICCKLQSYEDVFGIGYINETSTHVDTRTRALVWFGDEKKGISLLRAGFNSFNQYWGTSDKMLIVKTGVWNIRKEPDVKSAVVTTAVCGDTLEYTTMRTVLHATNTWYYIPSKKGWIYNAGVMKKEV